MTLPGMNPSFASLPGVTPAAIAGSTLTGPTVAVPLLCPSTLLPQLPLLLLPLAQEQGAAPRPSLVLGCKDKTAERCCNPDLKLAPSLRDLCQHLAVGSSHPVWLPHTDLHVHGESLSSPQPSCAAWPLPASRTGPVTKFWICTMEPGEPEHSPSLQMLSAGHRHGVPWLKAHGGPSLCPPML